MMSHFHTTNVPIGVVGYLHLQQQQQQGGVWTIIPHPPQLYGPRVKVKEQEGSNYHININGRNHHRRGVAEVGRNRAGRAMSGNVNGNKLAREHPVREVVATIRAAMLLVDHHRLDRKHLVPPLDPNLYVPMTNRPINTNNVNKNNNNDDDRVPNQSTVLNGK